MTPEITLQDVFVFMICVVCITLALIRFNTHLTDGERWHKCILLAATETLALVLLIWLVRIIAHYITLPL